MRQVSALGMGGATATRSSGSKEKTGDKLPSQLFDDMGVQALPEELHGLFSICSDPTAEPGNGVDANLYYSRLGKPRSSIDQSRNQSDHSRSAGRRTRNCQHPGELLLQDDNETISTCSIDDGFQGDPFTRLSSHKHNYQTRTGLLSELDDESIDLEGNDADNESFDVVEKDVRPFRKLSVSLASSTNTNTASKTVQDKMNDSHLLLMEAALACRDGTAWCNKSLAQEALEHSFSHLSRVSFTQW
jgi:hypothetical protein